MNEDLPFRRQGHVDLIQIDRRGFTRLLDTLPLQLLPVVTHIFQIPPAYFRKRLFLRGCCRCLLAATGCSWWSRAAFREWKLEGQQTVFVRFLVRDPEVTETVKAAQIHRSLTCFRIEYDEIVGVGVDGIGWLAAVVRSARRNIYEPAVRTVCDLDLRDVLMAPENEA